MYGKRLVGGRLRSSSDSSRELLEDVDRLVGRRGLVDKDLDKVASLLDDKFIDLLNAIARSCKAQNRPARAPMRHKQDHHQDRLYRSDESDQQRARVRSPLFERMMVIRHFSPVLNDLLNEFRDADYVQRYEVHNGRKVDVEDDDNAADDVSDNGDEHGRQSFPRHPRFPRGRGQP